MVARAMVQVGYTTRYRSLRDLHSLGACGPRCVNRVETSTYRLYAEAKGSTGFIIPEEVYKI